MKKFIGKSALFFLIMALAVTMLLGCSSTKTSADSNNSNVSQGTSVETKDASQPIKVRFICKKLSDAWFTAEDKGAKLIAEELNIDYVGIDADYNNERCMQAVDSVIAEEADGVVICITDAGLSDSVIKKFSEANIPILTIDDPMVGADGVQMPYLGFPTYDFGKEGGEMLAKLAKERNFFAEGNIVKVMMLDMATVQTLHDTALGFTDALKENLPELQESDIIFTDVKTGSFDDSIAAASATFNANPDVTHWIIPCVDDFPAYAAIKMLTENDFDFKNALVSGNGCYQPSLDIFNMGGDIANCYISNYMDPFLEGQKMMEFMNDLLRNNIPLPQDTRVGGGVVTYENWKDTFPEGEMPY